MNIHTRPSDCEAKIAAGAQAPCKVLLEWPLLSGWGDVCFSQDAQLLPEVDQWGLTTETDGQSLSKTKIMDTISKKVKKSRFRHNLKMTACF